MPVSRAEAESIYAIQTKFTAKVNGDNETLRIPLHLDASQVTFENPFWDGWVDTIFDKFKKRFVFNKSFQTSIVFDSLMIIGPQPGRVGNTPIRKSTIHAAPCSVATVAISIPSEYSGGDDILKFLGSGRRLEPPSLWRFNTGITCW